jgi:predicted metal-dependent peptidase
MKQTEEDRIKRGHITLMKHPQTAWYGGIMLMGNNEVVDASFTAYTDGFNKKYSRSFVQSIKSEPQLRGLILHENLHVALKQVAHGKAMFKENPKLANIAADFVVNDVIVHIDGKTPMGEKLVELPEGGLFDPMFHNWSMREVYDFLKKECDKPKRGSGSGDGGGGDGGSGDEAGDGEININGKSYKAETLDEHDFTGEGSGKEMSADEINDAVNKIDKALREGGILAGRLGVKVPRVINDMLTPKVDWREVLREFVSSAMAGKSEFTWRRLNKRQLANDYYLPSVEDETVGEIVVAIDTSGSIGSTELTEFASELASICDVVTPERVRVLWWDTKVHGEQVFEGNYTNIAGLLKPEGGGGTRVSCVSEWLSNNPKVNAECVIVFTDGYVENDPVWEVSKPTLWVVTANKSFCAPTGRKVTMERD